MIENHKIQKGGLGGGATCAETELRVPRLQHSSTPSPPLFTSSLSLEPHLSLAGRLSQTVFRPSPLSFSRPCTDPRPGASPGRRPQPSELGEPTNPSPPPPVRPTCLPFPCPEEVNLLICFSWILCFAVSRPLSSIPLQPLRPAASLRPPVSTSTSALLASTARSRISWSTTSSGSPQIQATHPYLILSRSFATPAPGGDPKKEAEELKAALSSKSDKPASKEVAATPDADKKKLTLWEKVKKEAKHYWHGTRLLGKEIRISAKLQKKVLNGGTLTRREQRQVRFSLTI